MPERVLQAKIRYFAELDNEALETEPAHSCWPAPAPGAGPEDTLPEGRGEEASADEAHAPPSPAAESDAEARPPRTQAHDEGGDACAPAAADAAVAATASSELEVREELRDTRFECWQLRRLMKQERREADREIDLHQEKWGELKHEHEALRREHELLAEREKQTAARNAELESTVVELGMLYRTALQQA